MHSHNAWVSSLVLKEIKVVEVIAAGSLGCDAWSIQLGPRGWQRRHLWQGKIAVTKSKGGITINAWGKIVGTQKVRYMLKRGQWTTDDQKLNNSHETAFPICIFLSWYSPLSVYTLVFLTWARIYKSPPCMSLRTDQHIYSGINNRYYVAVPS